MSAKERMATSVLKLLAEDAEGLGIIASAVQDSLVKPEGFKLEAKSRTFGLEINRFQWERAGKRMPFFRSRAVLAFAGVQNVRSRHVAKDIDAVHSLIDIRFASEGEAPAGIITLVFAGETQVQLAVECIDVTLVDIGPSWPTRRKPDHEKSRA